MTPSRWLACVLFGSVLGLAQAADNSQFPLQNGALGVTYERLVGGDFRLGDQRFHWQDGNRGALAFRTRVSDLEQIETVGGIDLYAERRTGDVPQGTLEDRALGFDLQCALAFHLTRDPAHTALDLSLAPFIRGGIAWHQLSLTDVTANNVRIVDEVGGARFAMAIGADARVVTFHRIELFAGGGFQLWTAGTVSAASSGTTQTTNVQLAFSGQEAFVHLGGLIWLPD
jgi:hypothetical protein